MPASIQEEPAPEPNEEPNDKGGDTPERKAEDGKRAGGDWSPPSFEEEHLAPAYRRGSRGGGGGARGEDGGGRRRHSSGSRRRSSWRRRCRHQTSEEDERRMSSVLKRIGERYYSDDDEDDDEDSLAGVGGGGGGLPEMLDFKRRKSMVMDDDCVKRVDDSVSEITKIPLAPVQLEPLPDVDCGLSLDMFNKEEMTKMGQSVDGIQINPENLRHKNPDIANKWKDKFIGIAPLGLPDAIDASYESMSCAETSSILRRYKDATTPRLWVHERWTDVTRYLIVLLIGPLTALVAIAIEQSIAIISRYKYRTLANLYNMAFKKSDWHFLLPVGFGTGFNLLFGLLAGLCIYFSPSAQGSGIPQVKCYLNGVKVPFLVRIKTLLAKSVGVVFSVSGGFAVGKEGPMIHSGAAIGAGISQGKSTSMKFTTRMFKEFRNDKEKRDFVACGAAAGVSAAFGAPMGGLLFAIEEGASHVSQAMLWRAAICSCLSFGTLNIVKSFVMGVPGQISNGGLINFGEFDNAVYNGWEMLVFILMGAIGAVSGALFNGLNKRMTMWRLRHMHFSKIHKLIEVCCCALIVGISAFMIVTKDSTCERIALGSPAATPKGEFVPFTLNCGFGKVNAAANLWYKTPESVVKSLFHDEINTHHWVTLLTFTAIYWLLACWTYGMGISNGLFVPCLLIGAAWGRCIGISLHTYLPGVEWGAVGKYALIGACAQLAGTVRLTYSLTCIVIEAIGNLTYTFPILTTVVVAKHLGDMYNKGIYDIHIDLMGIPMMEAAAPVKARFIAARHVMSAPVQVLPIRATVKDIMHILKRTTYNAFPVVETAPDLAIPTYGRLRGLITRDNILTMVNKRMFCNSRAVGAPFVRESYERLRDSYPRCPTTDSVTLSDREQSVLEIDFSLAMDLAPVAVSSSMTYTTVFDIFRTLGLRHIVVTNTRNEVVGMITRKNLIVIDAEHHFLKDPVLKCKPIYHPGQVRVAGYDNAFFQMLGLPRNSQSRRRPGNANGEGGGGGDYNILQEEEEGEDATSSPSHEPIEQNERQRQRLGDKFDRLEEEQAAEEEQQQQQKQQQHEKQQTQQQQQKQQQQQQEKQQHKQQQKQQEKQQRKQQQQQHSDGKDQDGGNKFDEEDELQVDDDGSGDGLPSHGEPLMSEPLPQKDANFSKKQEHACQTTTLATQGKSLTKPESNEPNVDELESEQEKPTSHHPKRDHST